MIQGKEKPMHHHYCCGHESIEHGHSGGSHHAHNAVLFPREEIVDPSVGVKEFFIGGSSPSQPVLEFMGLSGSKEPQLHLYVTTPSGTPDLGTGNN